MSMEIFKDPLIILGGVLAGLFIGIGITLTVLSQPIGHFDLKVPSTHPKSLTPTSDIPKRGYGIPTGCGIGGANP